GEQSADIAENHARLLAVGGDHHDSCPLARRQMRGPVSKAPKKHRNQRQRERLTGAPSADQPSLSRRRSRQFAPAGALLVEGALLHSNPCTSTGIYFRLSRKGRTITKSVAVVPKAHANGLLR